MKPINLIKMLPQMKYNYIDLEKLFNTSVKGNNLRIATFIVRDKITYNDGTVASCNGVPLTCNSATELEVPANEKIEFNETYNDCAFHELKGDMNTTASITNDIALSWVEKEATYAYSNFTGTDITAGLEADTSLVNAYDELVYGIRQLMSNGYNSRDMIIALDEQFLYDFKALDLACCDLGRVTSDEKSTMAGKLSVKEVVAVPREILSGNFGGGALTPATTIKFRIYVKDLALLNTYCERGPLLTEATGENVGGVQAFGSEKIGFGMFDDINAEVHAFYSTVVKSIKKENK